jgi:hypothetical protein
LAYVQYTAKHPKYGDAIRVLPGFFSARPKDWSTLIAQEGYFTFYPAGAAVSQKLIEIVDHQPVPPGRELPATYRRRGGMTPEGRVTAWLICDGVKEALRTDLSAEERRLFIASIWNHSFLVERLVAEWRPEAEPAAGTVSGSPPAPDHIREPEASSEGDKSRRASHYLYFPSEKVGKAVASVLKKRGFEVESRRGANEGNWLVLVAHSLIEGEEFQRVRDELEHLAQQHSGEYDGWELETNTTGAS